ncbi:hypothetical protein LEM8419_03526 [Neolewinella maritima]|uniref:Uncharacterized protein n=1 Tax=Neolewinella maritima TaxID=1383882 RepID=A0ABN8FDZ4_9BACT|nr:hypothetical protein LEM8419_03526 [Neolewinella maritima]
MAVPESCWLYPYIDYEVEYDDQVIRIDGHEYPNDNYHGRGYVRGVSDYDSLIQLQ